MQFCKPEPMSFNSRAFGQLPGSRPIYDSPFSFSHQNSVSKTQLHVYSYHLMIRPPRKCHEKSVHEFILLHEWPFSQSMTSPKRIHGRAADYCIVFSFAFFIRIHWYCTVFFPLKAQNLTTLESAQNLIESSKTRLSWMM